MFGVNGRAVLGRPTLPSLVGAFRTSSSTGGSLRMSVTHRRETPDRLAISSRVSPAFRSPCTSCGFMASYTSRSSQHRDRMGLGWGDVTWVCDFVGQSDRTASYAAAPLERGSGQ